MNKFLKKVMTREKIQNSSLNFSKEIFQDGQDSPSQNEVEKFTPRTIMFRQFGHSTRVESEE